MPILRKEKNKFTTVNNFFIDDTRLRLEGKVFFIIYVK